MLFEKDKEEITKEDPNVMKFKNGNNFKQYFVNNNNNQESSKNSTAI